MIYVSAEDFYKEAASIPPMPRQEELEYARQMKRGEISARECLIRGYLPMVAAHMKRLPKQNQTLGMLLFCRQALEKAVDSFDFLQDSEIFAHRLSWALRQATASYIVRNAEETTPLELDREQVLSILPDRDPYAHKGDFGKLLLLCGSRGYTGAAALSAMGALRSGAGLVFLGVPESIYAIEAVKLTEAIVFPLPDDDGRLSAGAIPEILERLPKLDAVLVGPGLGQSEGTFQVVKAVLENFGGPVVVDADGINVLARHKDILRGRKAATILTPHEGEFARLGGVVMDDRIRSARTLAEDLGCIVLLKGHETVVTDGQTVYLNHTGNPGMAVGGSGDVLAGIIVSLLGQGIAPLEAAACGAWLHGAAGDLCAAEIGQYGMLPSDMVEVLPRLLK